MAYTLSFHVGGTFHHDHNARRSHPEHADLSRQNLNYNWERDPGQLVAESYKTELAAYNQKQIDQRHPKRQIKDLHKHLYSLYDTAKEKDKATRTHKYSNKAKCPEKEFIIQIGDDENHPPHDISNRILMDYWYGFSERNPNLLPTQFAIHGDEATTHAHTDVIPKAFHETGLMKQYSFENALKEMGFTTYFDKDQGRRITAFEQWMNRERNVLKQICKEYDLDIEPTRSESRKYYLSKQDYIAQEEERKAQERIANIQRSIDKKQSELAELTKMEQDIKAHLITAQQVRDIPYKKTLIGGKITLDEEDFKSLKTTAERVDQTDSRERKIEQRELHLACQESDYRQKFQDIDRELDRYYKERTAKTLDTVLDSVDSSKDTLKQFIRDQNLTHQFQVYRHQIEEERLKKTVSRDKSFDDFLVR